MSDITLLSPHELTERDCAAWNELRQGQVEYASPFFAPEFTRAVGEVRPRVRIARFGSARSPSAYFPFECSRLAVARPVGFRFNDDHGPILGRGQQFEPVAFVRSLGLLSWNFHCQPAHLAGFPVKGAAEPARYLDLSGGFEAYRKARKAQGSDIGDDLIKPVRRLDKNNFDLRFEWHTTNPQVFQSLIEWKRAQYRATGFTDVLATAWPRHLLQRLALTSTVDFRGVLSALWLRDRASGEERLAAVHLGLVSGTVMHSWFPAYDGELAHLAPGLCLLGQIAGAASSEGVTRIRLGPGEERYKVRLGSDAEWMQSGHVDAEPSVTMLRSVWQGAKQSLRSQLASKEGTGWWAAAHRLKERWALQ